jgi:Tfp pilus assembly protein PilX
MENTRWDKIMKVGDALFTALMIFLVFGYMKITDYQLADLDKRIALLELRMSVCEHKLGLPKVKEKK